jgi:GxxExxY protein
MSIESVVSECAEQVFHILGSHHSESTYQNALEMECQLRKIQYIRQPTLNILYKGNIVGFQRPDIIINNQVVIEIKVCREATIASRNLHHWKSQLGNYLKDHNYNGMLIVFGVSNVYCHSVQRDQDDNKSLKNDFVVRISHAMQSEDQ